MNRLPKNCWYSKYILTLLILGFSLTKTKAQNTFFYECEASFSQDVFEDDKGCIIALTEDRIIKLSPYGTLLWEHEDYTLLNGSGVVIVPTPEQITPGRFTKLGVGFYQVRVVSGDCNEVSAVIEIKEPLLGVTYTVNKTDVTCNGQNNGRIDVSGTGGTGKIMYSISDRSDQFFDDGIFENLAPGSYKVIIQDENGCYEPFNFKIDEPPLLFGTLQPNSLMPEICAGDKDGAFSITVAGGVNPYSVSLDAIKGIYTQGAAGQTDFDFTNLSGGTHKVYIKDASNCTSELEVIMPNAVVINY